MSADTAQMGPDAVAGAARPAANAARPLRVRALPGVFRPRSDARLLAQVMAQHGHAAGAEVLDLFTGSGVLALAAAACGARRVTAIDLSRRAALTVRLNARANRLPVRVRRGDMFAAVPGERFDLITANPPYLPGEARLPRHGAARAWEGGPDGRVLVDRLCADARAHLQPGGRLLLVQSSLTGEAATIDRLRRGGLDPTVLVRHRGPLGPLARRRLAALRAQGQHDRLADDATEELLVIDAVAV